jgi:hypothetical protein
MKNALRIVLIIVALAGAVFAADAALFMHTMKGEAQRLKTVKGEELEALCQKAMQQPENVAELNKVLNSPTQPPEGSEYNFPVVLKMRHHVWTYGITLPCKLKITIKDSPVQAQ